MGRRAGAVSSSGHRDAFGQFEGGGELSELSVTVISATRK